MNKKFRIEMTVTLEVEIEVSDAEIAKAEESILSPDMQAAYDKACSLLPGKPEDREVEELRITPLSESGEESVENSFSSY